jgi:hypothetical protein
MTLLSLRLPDDRIYTTDKSTSVHRNRRFFTQKMLVWWKGVFIGVFEIQACFCVVICGEFVVVRVVKRGGCRHFFGRENYATI